VRADAQLLQDARLDLRLHHRFAVRERDLQVRERELALGGRHEVLALHLEEQVQHLRVEDLPGADLLLDHVEARFLDVHGGCVHLEWHSGDWRGGRTGGGEIVAKRAWRPLRWISPAGRGRPPLRRMGRWIPPRPSSPARATSPPPAGWTTHARRSSSCAGGWGSLRRTS